jgi:Protein of unknown function (DUF3540)
VIHLFEFTFLEKMTHMTEISIAPQARNMRKQKNQATAELMHTASPIPGEWCVGIVHASEQGGLTITSGGLEAAATRAVSCLLEPASGDSVACLRVAPNEVWIVAVLSREDGVANVLSCKGDTKLQVNEGALKIGAKHLSLDGDKLDVISKSMQMATETAEITGNQFKVVGTTIKIVGSIMSTVMQRINQFSTHYLRTTDGTDRVAATHVEMEAKQLMRLNAEHTLISGEQLVKARGAQIHFG